MGALRRATAGIALASALALPVAAAADGPAAYQADPAHSGAAPGTTFAPPLGKKWVRRDLGESPSFPVLAEGRVFLTAGSTLYALDRATGGTVWSRAMRARGVAYDDGRVFAVDTSGTMQALSAANGSVLWSARLPGASSSISPPTAYGDFVYASSSSTMFGVNQDTGLVVWSSGAETGERSVPAVDSDKTYTSGGCGDVTALERRTGTDVWHYDGRCGGGLGSTTAVFGGQVFGGGVILDALTGLLRDTLPSTQVPAFAGTVAFVVNGKELYARDNGSGVTLWRYTDENSIETPPLVAGEFVYVVDESGKLTALSRSSGQKVWESDTGGGYGGSYTDWPGLGAAGEHLVVSSGSRVVGYGPGADAPGVDDPDQPPSDSDTLRMSASKTKIAFGRKITLSGQLDRGSESPDVEIQADPWPFDNYVSLGNVKTRNGYFEHPVKPERNTRYRAVFHGTFPDAVSREITVFTDFSLGFRIYARGRRKVLIRMTAAGPPDAKLRNARMFVYHFRARARVANRVGAVKLRGRGTKVKGQATMRTPVLKRSDLFFTCRKETADDGFGEPEPRLADCGKRRLR